MILGCIVISILVVVCVLTAGGAVGEGVERIAVPETFPPHPRLFMDQGEIDTLKAWADREPWLREYIDEFVADVTQRASKRDRGEADDVDNVELAKEARDFAFAYVLSGRVELAAQAANILRSYVELYPTYLVHFTKGRAAPTTLGESTWGIALATAYDLIYNSGQLSQADLQAIDSEVLRPCGQVLRTCNHRFRSNWRNRAMAGFGAIGFCIGDRDLIDEALNGRRDRSGKLVRDGFVQHLANAVLADGMYYERSLGYHYASSINYTYLMEAARHSGVDLWRLEVVGDELDAGADVRRRFGATGAKTIKMMLDVPFYYVFGDTSAARVANCGEMRLERTWFYEAAWRQLGDPKYAWIIHRGQDGRRPKEPAELMHMAPDVPPGEWDLARDARLGVTGRHANACTLLPNGGYTILRQGADENDVAVLMTYGKYGSGHSHPDKLGIVLYAAGRHVVPEVNHFKYGDDDFLAWNKQTIAHNTVTVDEIAQRPQLLSTCPWDADTPDSPVRGRPVFFHAGEDLKAGRADCDTAYEGVYMDRTIAMVDSVVVDFFRVRSGSVHQYDFALHIDGELAGCTASLGDRQGGPLSDGFGYDRIADVRRAAMDSRPAELTYTTADDGPKLHLTLMPSDGAELIVANGHEDADGHRKAMAIVRAKADNADSVSVMSLADGLTVRRVDDLPDGVIGVEISRPDGHKDIVLSAEAPRTFAFAGLEIAGELALLRQAADGAISVVDAVA